jgi:hypothetical protein
VLAGINADVYRAALIKLDSGAAVPRMLAAFAQLRRSRAGWTDYGGATIRHLPKFMKGGMGAIFMGGWARA